MDYIVVTLGVLFVLAALAGLVALVNTNIIKVPPSTVAIFSGRNGRY